MESSLVAPPLAKEILRMGERIAELEKIISDMHGSGRRFTFDREVYIQGLRVGPGDYVLMRIGPATVEEHPF